jgi:hypothetical protein
MPKKTWIDKSDAKTTEIPDVSKTTTSENEGVTLPTNPRQKKKDSSVVFELNPINLESVKNGLSNNGKMKVELTEDEIVRAVAKRKKRVVVVKKRDENGNLLTKTGSIDKRPETAKKNLVNSKVYKRLLENQQIPKKPVVSSIPKPVVEDSDSDTEFELEEVKPTKVVEVEPIALPEPEPTITVKRKVSSTELYLREQEQKRERELQEQIAKMKQMEEENNKLKNRFVFNDYLNKMTHLSTTMKIKY